MFKQMPISPLPNALPTAPEVEMPPPTSALDTWLMAFTQPKPGTYAAIAHSPRATAKTAFGWIFGAAIFESAVGSLAEKWNLAPGVAAQDAGGSSTELCGGVGSGIAAVLGFVIFTGITHLLARAFGGRATFGQLSYAVAAIEAPLTIMVAVLALLGHLPLVGIGFDTLSGILVVYVAVLEVIVVRGVHEIGWTGSFIAAWGVPLLLICGCLASVGFLILSASGASLGNVLSELGPLPFPVP